jgi:hypothetical protein
MHFKRFGWIYIPVSFWGWIITVIYLAVSVYTLVIIGQNYNSIKNSLIRFFPYFICFSVILFWIAENTSKDKPEEK